MIYENRKQNIAPKKIYYKRIINNVIKSSILIIGLLFIGTAGYYYFSPDAALIDAFHNAAMILSGMGPTLQTELTFTGKIFSSLYAIFSGIVFMTSIGFILAPAVHRIFHRLHLEEKEK